MRSDPGDVLTKQFDFPGVRFAAELMHIAEDGLRAADRASWPVEAGKYTVAMRFTNRPDDFDLEGALLCTWRSSRQRRSDPRSGSGS
jgi:hypothetical protein